MKKLVIGVITIGMFLGLAACGSSTTQEESQTAASTAAQSEVSTEDETHTDIEVTDSNGKVTVPYQPEKVVVFDNSALDTMDVLGVGDRVVGAATSNLPAYLSAFETVESAGGIKEPDLEKINQLQPDLIIISGRQRDYQDELAAIAPTIFLSVDNDDTWASIESNIQTLAEIFGKEEEAQRQMADLQSQIDTLHASAEESGLTALIVMVNEGNLSAFGPGSRYSILYDTFGFIPVDDTLEASTHGESISYEFLLEKNPDLIFVVDRTQAIGGEESQSAFISNEIVQETTAGQNDHIIELDAAVWYLAGSGIESIERMLADVQPAVE
ncbi:siderophore ABC transporter substrate-binding protein [Enterococcus sp.]|uniref:siderophore ABC transporter substrate-binding protein n=1 Tax=Enterococcus sp. TaxID=35783 RepID=UPI0028A786EB|nr:siderophore ABC transporter substrate-binding protein [Enterococcus sp.]